MLLLLTISIDILIYSLIFIWLKRLIPHWLIGQVALTALLGLFTLSWLSFFATLILGFYASYWVLAATVLLFGLTYGVHHKIFLWFSKKNGRDIKNMSSQLFKKYWPTLIIAVMILGVLAFISHTHFFLNQEGGWYSGGSTWADLSLHAALVTHFSGSDQLRFDSPVYANTPNTYPWLFDFYTAWLYHAGWTLKAAFIFSTFQAVGALMLLLMTIARLLGQKNVGMISTLLLFFFAGAAGFIYFPSDWLASQNNPLEFLANSSFQYTNYPAKNIYFSSPIPDILLPQRGILVGLSTMMGVVLSIGLWLKNKSSAWIWIACLLTALLPLFHVHLFLVTIGILLITAVYTRFGSHKKDWLLGLTTCLVLAAPQLLWLTQTGQTATFLALDPLWIYSFTKPFSLFDVLGFILLNFSVVFLLAQAIVLVKTRDTWQKKWQRILLLSVNGILLLSLLIRFQPNAYDNIKFLTAALLLSSLLSGKVLQSIWKKSWMVAVLLLLYGTLSGSLAVVRESQLKYLFAAHSEMAVLADLRSILPTDAIVATAPDHHTALNNLGGWSVYVGYPGWLWTYGIDFSDRINTLQAVYAGDALGVQAMTQEGVTHIVITPKEVTDFLVSDKWYNCPMEYSNGAVHVLSLKKVIDSTCLEI